MRYFEQDGSSLVWRSKNETLVLTPWGENSLRVRSAMMVDVEDTRYALLDPEYAPSEIKISDRVASISCGNLTAEVVTDDWNDYATITFRNQRGEVLLQETPSHFVQKLHARKFEPHLGGDYTLTQTFLGQEGEHIYGMGQYQEDVLDWKGCALELAQRNSQASVPFYMSSRGYGFLWHNPAIGSVSFCENRTTWTAESTKQLDYWVTAGDTPAQISQAYAKATGFAPMMPEYGLGFWQCKLRYWNQEQILSVAREYKRRNLPIDVIVCDFFHWPRLGDYCFDKEFFPDPAAMVRELKEMGIELLVSVWPLVSQQCEDYPNMLQKGLLARAEYGDQIGSQFMGEDGMFLDMTNPRARKYLWEKIRRNYYVDGVRSFWLDVAEPEYSSYDFKNFRFYMGTHQQVGNIYPQVYARVFFDGMTAEGQQEIVSLTRCAWAGSQRYGSLLWSGDINSKWEDLRRQISAGLNVGCAGIPWWTTDIGGFIGGVNADPEFRELLIRWFQWGCYCPVMRLHGDRLPSEDVYHKDGSKAFYSGADNEVWSFGEEAYDILTKYMRRREEMRDYVRSLMKQAHEAGTPVMRAMFYEFPQDENCAKLKDQYMFGPDYLVAPVLEMGARSRSVYLPAGQWQDVDTGIVYDGNQSVTVDAPLERIPVLKKIG